MTGRARDTPIVPPEREHAFIQLREVLDSILEMVPTQETPAVPRSYDTGMCTTGMGLSIPDPAAQQEPPV